MHGAWRPQSVIGLRKDGAMDNLSGSKPLSLNEIRARCAEFVISWRESSGDERQDGQSFVRDLLAAFGISETRAALYEKRANRTSTGNQGYIDALVPGLLLVEMKSSGKNLGLAEIQALDYVNALSDTEQPRYILTSDFKNFRLLDLLAPKGSDVTQFSLTDLPKRAEALAFLAGYQSRSFGSQQQEQASIRAAKIMAELYEALDGSGFGDHEASVFLVRLLFALYADDAAVWERDLFAEFLERRTANDGSDLGPQLTMLFQVMNQPSSARSTTLDEILTRFPYVNGGIFAEVLPIPSFNQKMRSKLIAAAAFNWSSISPAIFGSLFQAVKSPEARRELGEHYTTETNIRKTLDPLFLDELNEEFVEVSNDIAGLRKLRLHLGELRLIDPACGCGNFLVVAYRELRALELRILLRLQELGDKTSSPTLFFDRNDLAVRLEHIAGIELEEWPARIAATALRLAEHRANMDMQLALGRAPDTLPLDTATVIRIGNSLRMDWGECVGPSDYPIIMGNPPFIGMAMMNGEQQADNRYVLSSVEKASGLRTGRLDYVACWYVKAAQLLAHRNHGRAAFVSTNSLIQGEQARTMVPLMEVLGCEVDFGHRTFKWTSEAPGAASVYCVVVGFSSVKRSGKRRRLFSYPNVTSEPIETVPKRLNFYLVDGPNFVPTKLGKPLSDGMPFATKGSQPTDGGHLLLDEIEAEEASQLLDVAPYVKRFVQAQDMLQGSPRRWCLWLTNAEPRVLRTPFIHQRLSAVAEMRRKSPTSSVQDFASKPMLFTQNRQPQGRYFALPRVSSENRTWIPGRFLDGDVIAGDGLTIFPAAQTWHAALLQSSMFMAWVDVFAGRLESRRRLSPDLCYFPIPFPNLDRDAEMELGRAWEAVAAARNEFTAATLSDLYDPTSTPPGLLDAHRELDRVVDRTFGARRALRTQEDRLALLFERIDNP